ncbi:MAG: DUF2310 family Zn-ribbon-containing protein [Clostridiaceae bacterium]|nr:DUF2310 family Zn-ribbon-containing protein [Clostridiaceae bacterium]
MKAYNITFKPILPLQNEDESVSMLWDYLEILVQNGQIMLDYLLLKVEDEFIATVTLPDDDSLSEKYNNCYINDMLCKIKAVFSVSQPYYIAENTNYDNTCTCDSPSWYMLYADYSTDESPVVCGDCGHEVALHKLPYIFNEQEYYTLLSWQQMYQHVHSLWVLCLSDRFTYRQLSNPHSQLSKLALEIRAELEEKLKKPVYYYIYHADKPLNNCPNCNQEWIHSPNIKTVDYICPKCKLATDK